MLTYADVLLKHPQSSGVERIRQLQAGATGVVICSYPMEHLRVIPSDDCASIPKKKEGGKERKKNGLPDARALLFAALDTRASGAQFACFTGTKVGILTRQRGRRLKPYMLTCADVC
jgi:hypothetical protein